MVRGVVGYAVGGSTRALFRRRQVATAVLALVISLSAGPLAADEGPVGSDEWRNTMAAKQLKDRIVEIATSCNEIVAKRLERHLDGPYIPIYMEKLHETLKIRPTLIRSAGLLGVPVLLAMMEVKIPSDEEIKEVEKLLEEKVRELRGGARGHELVARVRRRLWRDQRTMTEFFQCVGLRALADAEESGVALAVPRLLPIFDASIERAANGCPARWHLAVRVIARAGAVGEEILPDIRKLLKDESLDDRVGETLILAVKEMGVGPLGLAAKDIFHAYKHGDGRTQEAAAEALLSMREKAAKMLSREVATRKKKEKKLAAAAATHYAEVVLRWMRESGEEDQAWTRDVLGALVPAAFSVLKAEVTNEAYDIPHRVRVAVALGANKSTVGKAVPVWIKLLRVDDARLRLAVLGAIEAGGKRARRAVLAVRRLTKHEDAETAAAANAALAAIAPPEKD